MVSRSISAILWTLVCVNSLALVVGGLTTWLGYAIPARLKQFGLLPELIIIAGFASLIVACIGLCALNYSSHHALNIYGACCTIFVLMLVFGIPQTWYKSSHFSQGNLLMNIIYFSLLATLLILLVFAFTFANYLRRQEQENEADLAQLSDCQSSKGIGGAEQFGLGVSGSGKGGTSGGGCNSPRCTCKINLTSCGEDSFAMRSHLDLAYRRPLCNGSTLHGPTRALEVASNQQMKDRYFPWQIAAGRLESASSNHDNFCLTTRTYQRPYQAHTRGEPENMAGLRSECPSTRMNNSFDQTALMSQYPLTHKGFYRTMEPSMGTSNRAGSDLKRKCSSSRELALMGRRQGSPSELDVGQSSELEEEEEEEEEEAGGGGADDDEDSRYDGPADGAPESDDYAPEIPMIRSAPQSERLKSNKRRWTLARSICHPRHLANCRHQKRSFTLQRTTRDDSSVQYGHHHLPCGHSTTSNDNPVYSSGHKSARCRCNILKSIGSLSSRQNQLASPLVVNSNPDGRHYVSRNEFPFHGTPKFISHMTTLNGAQSYNLNRKSAKTRSGSSSAAAAAAALFGGVAGALGGYDDGVHQNLFDGSAPGEGPQESALVDDNDCNLDFNNHQLDASALDSVCAQMPSAIYSSNLHH